jgi:hypothetical protein
MPSCNKVGQIAWYEYDLEKELKYGKDLICRQIMTAA